MRVFIPTEMAAHVHETLLAAGADVGLGHAGLRALGSLRMEKGYRDYGHDLDNTDTLLEAGRIGFTAARDKRGFVGQGRVERRRRRLRRRCRSGCCRCASTTVAPLLHHGEVVYRDGVHRSATSAPPRTATPSVAPSASR